MKEVIEGVFLNVSEYKGNMRVDLRKYYQDKKDGDAWKPTSKGINLSPDEFEDLIVQSEELLAYVKEELKKK